MKKNYVIKSIMILAIVAILGLGVNAFAGWGMGSGPGFHHRGWGEPGYGCMMYNLSDDDLNKLAQQRRDFFEATRDLRYDIYEMQLDLRSELAKKIPDAEKAIKLQQEISKLESKLDQNRIDHMIKMKKINPNIGRGFMERGRKGYGPSFGGPCWR